MRPSHTNLLLASILSGLTLVGCTGSIRQSFHETDDANHAALDAIDGVRSTKPKSRGAYTVHTGQWVDNTPVPLAPRDSGRDIACSEEWHPQRLVSIDEFAQIVSRDCHLNVRITPDAYEHLMYLKNPSQGGKGIPSTPIGQGATLPGIAGVSSAPLGASGSSTPDMIDLDYSGAVAGLLDRATSQVNLSWKVSGQDVLIFFKESRTFRVNAIPNVTKMSTTVLAGATTRGGQTGSSSGGTSAEDGMTGSNQSTVITMNNDLRDDLQKTIRTMLSPFGVAGPLTGALTITVTDTPDVLSRIGDYIDSQNSILTKQVLFNVKVVSVTLKRSDDYGINWNAVWKSVNGIYGLSLANTVAGTVSGASNTTVSILPNATGKASQLAGSSAVVQALSEQGKIGSVISPSATTLNMQPVLVQVSKVNGYVASSQLTATAQVGSTSTLQQASITSGFSMTIVPDVLADGKTVLLQYDMTLTSDPVLRKATSGGTTIEIPSMDSKSLDHKVLLKTGETLVLSGFEQNATDGTADGIGTPMNWALGGSTSRADSRTVLVVMITPVVTN